MVWRGGITEFQATAFPVLLASALVLRLEADADEARTLHRIRLRVIHSVDGPWQEIPVAFKEPERPDLRSYLNLLVNLHFGVLRPGDGHIEVSVDEELLAPNIQFSVRLIPLPPGLQAT